MKKSIFRRLTALLLVLVIGLVMPACSMLPENTEAEMTTADLPIITDEAESDGKYENEFEDNNSQAPPAEEETEAAENTTEKTTSQTTVKTTKTTKTKKTAQDSGNVVESGKYDTKDEVALYIHTFGHLPSNYITKKQAEKLGWSGGSLKKYAPGCCIGGDRFGNYEGLLPKAKGRTYTECDIGTLNSNSRGAKRIIFSNDGLIYYTDDHYESFTQLY